MYIAPKLDSVEAGFGQDQARDHGSFFATKVVHEMINALSKCSRYFQHAHFIPILGVGKRCEY